MGWSHRMLWMWNLILGHSGHEQWESWDLRC
jgi:hypothetical protein